GRRVRGGSLGDRVRGVRALCRELLLLQQDLWRAGWGDHLPGVAVDLQHRHASGCRMECGDRAGPQNRGGSSRGRGAVRRAAQPREAEAARGGQGVSKILFVPFSVIGGLIAGKLAKSLFDGLWGLVDEEESPGPEHRDVPWPK